MSGGDFKNVMPTAQRIFTPSPQAPAQPAGAGAADPRLSKFINPDGSVRFADVVKAPDGELQQALTLLSPQRRAQLKTQLASFKPSLGQSLGAKAMGIDIDAQRGRFQRLLQ